MNTTPMADDQSLAGDSRTEAPLLTLEAGSRWSAVNVREIWSYRELLYFLTWRDIKVRYKQAVLGIAWAVIQPLLTIIMFALLFGKFAKIPTNGVPYPVFSFAAVLPWTFFANAVANGANSVTGSANLITKVYFPRLILPAAAVAAALFDLLIAFACVAPIFAWYGIAPSWRLLLLPALVIVTALFALSIAVWMAALNVLYRDVRYALPFFIQMWMFASPVIYSSTTLPNRWQVWLSVNPMTGIIESFRAAMTGRPIPGAQLSYAVVATLVAVVLSAFSFRRIERRFADIV